jgi:aminopeptidase N
MDWWNELWLKEGFATWIGSYAIDHLYPGNIPFSPDPRFFADTQPAEWNVWAQFVVRRKSKGIPCC